MKDKRDRYRGCLLGLAVGDALGTTLEFKLPGSFEPINDIVGGGPHNLEAGQWTDDTSMALCLAASLIEKEDFDPLDQLEKYTAWHQEGYLSSTGECFDIGNTVFQALQTFQMTWEPYCGSTDSMSAGNGSIMRLAPVPLCYANRPAEAVELSGESSLTTHGAGSAVDACRYLGGLIVGIMNGFVKEEILAKRFAPVKGLWEQQPLDHKIAEIADGSFKRKSPPEIKGTGYVVDSLEAALWAFYHSTSFEEGALLAVNLGDDADTTGAVYGQIAGAYYGQSGIPAHWQQKIHSLDLILETADKLYEMAETKQD